MRIINVVTYFVLTSFCLIALTLSGCSVYGLESGPMADLSPEGIGNDDKMSKNSEVQNKEMGIPLDKNLPAGLQTATLALG